MSLKRRTQSTASESTINYENLEAGEHEARLVYVADLGLQTREYKGEVKPNAQQISLGLEIIGKSVTIEDKEHPRILFTSPFNIFSNLTEKGKELEFYRVFNSSAVEDTDADWEKYLGSPCNVIVKHTKGKGDNADKVYDNISHLTAIPKKYQGDIEEAKTSPAIGDSDDPENVVTKALYGLAKFVYDKRVEEEEAPKSKPKSAQKQQDEFEDDIPW
jgi:hypothetical protein